MATGKITIAPSVRKAGRWDVFVGGFHRVTKSTLKGARGAAKKIATANKGMYEIVERNPTLRPGRIRVRVNGRIHPAVAKKVNGRVKIFVTPKVAAKINPKRWREYTLYPGGITFPTAADARAALVAERYHTASAYVVTPSGKRLKVAHPRKRR